MERFESIGIYSEVIQSHNQERKHDEAHIPVIKNNEDYANQPQYYEVQSQYQFII